MSKKVKLMLGDNLESLKKIPDNSIDSVVTDPPYALNFMNKKWDAEVPSVEFWTECLRVLKPGGHVLSFGGTRTYHRMVVNMEDAGFEIRDQIMWIYSTGFPKSHNVKKQLEKSGYKICECSKQNTEHDLRPLSETNISQTIDLEDKQRQTLLTELSQQNTQVSEYTTSDVRGEKPSVEGWSNTIQEEGQLQGNNLQTSSRTPETNVEEGWVYNGAQNDNGSDDGSYINENGSGSSHRPQSEQQQSKQFGTMADKRRPQESRSRKICGGCGKQVVDLTLGHTALKPAVEPICLARKPLSEKSVAENVLKWRTGGINVDGCRVGSEPISHGTSKMDIRGKLGDFHMRPRITVEEHITEGRFPANIILECCCDEVIEGDRGEVINTGGSRDNCDLSHEWGYKEIVRTNYTDKGDIHTNPECPCYIMDQQSGESKSSPRTTPLKGNLNGVTDFGQGNNTSHSDKGGASRFFYQAKVSKKERNMGLDGFDEKQIFGDEGQTFQGLSDSKKPSKNTHPTVKPINLLTYLCRLITPPNGIILDPFMGSGSTGIAAQIEGFRFVGMEMDPDYFKIAEARIDNCEQYKKLIKEK
jgi:DNA modification methylase